MILIPSSRRSHRPRRQPADRDPAVPVPTAAGCGLLSLDRLALEPNGVVRAVERLGVPRTARGEMCGGRHVLRALPDHELCLRAREPVRFSSYNMILVVQHRKNGIFSVLHDEDHVCLGCSNRVLPRRRLQEKFCAGICRVGQYNQIRPPMLLLKSPAAFSRLIPAPSVLRWRPLPPRPPSSSPQNRANLLKMPTSAP